MEANTYWLLLPLLKPDEIPERWSQSPVLPRTRRAYETHLSAGSTAIKTGVLTRSCAGLIRLPSERIAANALRANEWSERGDPAKLDCLILSQVSLLFLVNHAPESASLA